MNNISSRLAKGSIWISSARGLVNFFGFVSTIVLARLLVPADFGVVAIGNTLLAIVGAFTALPLSQALIQHQAPTADHFHTAWTLGAFKGILLGVVFAIFALPAAEFYNEPHLANVMYGLAFSMCLSGLGNPRRIMLQKSLVFWQDFMLSVAQKLVAVIVAVSVAYLYRSYWALILSIIAGQIASILISYTALPFRPRVRFVHYRELLSFSVWLTLSQVVNTLNWRFDQLLIGKLLGRSEVGFYTVGDTLAVLPTREATQPLTQTLFPAFSQLSNDINRLQQGYKRAQAVVTAAALPLGVGMALVAAPMVEFFMGAKWLAAVPVIQALASIYALQTLGSLAQPLGMSLGNTRMLFVRDTQLFIIRVPLIAAGLYFGGLHGVLIARIFTGTIAIGFNFFIVRKLLNISILAQIQANVRSLSSCILMSLAIYLMQDVGMQVRNELGLLAQLLLMVIVGGAVYITSIFAMWRFAGKPNGAETELLRMLQGVWRKFARYGYAR
ncbi:polysaccharide biosynthesis protein [Rhizobium etli bv. phaseoli str. IE4803]|nr:polysaccharide biosynthesis protein [Rhizobium etli bv. phaseoli str. IE4803]